MRRTHLTSGRNGGRLTQPAGGPPVGPGLLFDSEPGDFTHDIELLTISEVAVFLKVSVSAVRRLKDQRRIPFIKVGGRIRFAKTDVTSFLERARVNPPSS